MTVDIANQLSCYLSSRLPDKDPVALLEDIIAQYRSLFTEYQLKGVLQVADWLDAHKHEIPARPAIVHILPSATTAALAARIASTEPP